MSGPRLILASASPRRRELLEQAGFRFLICPADVDEEAYPQGLSPDQLALFLAQAKAQVIAERFPQDVVLSADTVVALGEKALGKAADALQAKRMLHGLSGSSHAVITAVCGRRLNPDWSAQRVVHSQVAMRQLTDAEIDRYVATNQWQGKAGAYGIQDQDPFVVRVSGSASNIVGLPMEETQALLAEAGVVPGGSGGI